MHVVRCVARARNVAKPKAPPRTPGRLGEPLGARRAATEPRNSGGGARAGCRMAVFSRGATPVVRGQGSGSGQGPPGGGVRV
eukprot:2502704-Prymnesium_polylepis.1